MDQTEQREEAVFEAALELAAAERDAYLDQACAGDAELRRRVEMLLGAFERAGGFMKEPAVSTPGGTARACCCPAARFTERLRLAAA
jgi:eukaryotic-like serine/threonine-protein kinase